MILSRLRGVQRAGKGWLAFCPGHDDQHKRSLSINLNAKGDTLLNCHAMGCAVEVIASKVGLELADLFADARSGHRANGHVPRPSERSGGAPGREVAHYDYPNEMGVLGYQVVRYEPKTFRPRVPNATGGWTFGLPEDVRRVLYRLPELPEQRRIYVVEGEKDADRLWSLGRAATTTASGGQGWDGARGYGAQMEALAPDEVILLPDNDPTGRKYASDAGADLSARNFTLRVLCLSGLSEKGDVSDWLDAGHTIAELDALASAAPTFTEWTSGTGLLRNDGYAMTLSWPDAAQMVVRRIHEGSDGVHADLTVLRRGIKVHWGRWSLSSTGARERLAKAVEKRSTGVTWDDYFEEAAFRFTEAHREGAPTQLVSSFTGMKEHELMPDLFYAGETSMLFAHGDTGKSMLALALMIALETGTPLPGGRFTPRRRVRGIFLDFEKRGPHRFAQRTDMLARGLGIPFPTLNYRNMKGSLLSNAESLTAEIHRKGIEFVVIDSLFYALTRGEGARYDEPITAFFDALKYLAPATVLIVNHVPNEEAKDPNARRFPYGGAFAWNAPGLILELRRDRDGADPRARTIIWRKANDRDELAPPAGLRFMRTLDDGLALEPFTPPDPRDAPDETAAPRVKPPTNADRLHELLLFDGGLSRDLAASKIGVSGATLRNLLIRERSREGGPRFWETPDGRVPLTPSTPPSEAP
jgi:hypothetical protein